MPSAPMPLYKCHKEVNALKILGVEQNYATLGVKLAVESPFAPIEVSQEWVQKHRPEAGGYYVVYKDGYTSYSPAAAFEEGYSLIK